MIIVDNPDKFQHGELMKKLQKTMNLFKQIFFASIMLFEVLDVQSYRCNLEIKFKNL